MEELQQISEITIDLRFESVLTTKVDKQSTVTLFFDKVAQVVTRLKFISKLP